MNDDQTTSASTAVTSNSITSNRVGSANTSTADNLNGFGNGFDPRIGGGRYVINDRSTTMTPENAKATALEYVTDDLLEKVVSVSPSSTSKDAVRKYFFALVDGMSCCPALLYDIVVSILIGIARGPPFINKRVSLGAGSEPMTILMWACQWKLLRYNSEDSFIASDELVRILINAGANVNDTLPSNSANAMFLAVKYAGLDAIDSLIRAGINLQQHNVFGQSCMYNALEYPRYEVIEKLLSSEQEGDGNMSIHETFTTKTANEDLTEIVTIGESSLPDMLIMFLYKPSNSIISWRILGPPSLDDIGKILILLRQKGASFTKLAAPVLNVIGKSFNDSYDLTEFCGTNLFMGIAPYLVGNKIPERFRHELPPFAFEQLLENDTDGNDSSFGGCSICLGEKKKTSTLYCGHSFCRNCILEYGRHCETSNCGQKGCPLCRRSLCLDVTLKDAYDLKKLCSRGRQADEFKGSDVMGLQIERGWDQSQSFLKDSQIIEEAKFRGIYNNGRVSVSSLREQIIRENEQGAEQSAVGATFSNVRRADTGEQDVDFGEKTSQINVDLSTSVSMNFGGENTFLSPKDGTSCVDIKINGVPLLARVSNISLYTMISATLVDELGLKRIRSLKSKKFVGISGRKLKNSTFTCLEPIAVSIGGIDVNLRNAVETSPPVDEMFGIQLGIDFLGSAAWCPIDVEIEGGDDTNQAKFMRLDGGLAYLLEAPTQGMLRYYSRDGRTALVPLLPFGPFEGNINYNISLKESAKFDQCFFCNRVFPEGMLFCENCDATYCDERCQRAGWKLHKRLHEEVGSGN